VTVGALTTVASAVDLEKAVKGTKLTGYIRYRHNPTWNNVTNGNSQKGTISTNEYKAVFNFVMPVNDMVKANIKFVTVGTTSDTTGDANPNLVTKFANFIVSPADNLTLIVGKQALVTPFADPADQSGTGAVASMNLGNIKLYAGAYSNTNATPLGAKLQNADIYAAGVTADLGIVNGAFWYANIETKAKDTAGANVATDGKGKSNTAMYFEANAKVSIVTLQVAHATVDYDDKITGKDANKKEQTRFVASANVGMFNGTIGYVTTGKEGGDVTLGDTDAKANFGMEILEAANTADASLMYFKAGVKVDKVSAALEYLTGDDKNNVKNGDKRDLDETKVSVGYAMSKNFNVSAWYAKAKTEVNSVETKYKKARIEAKYTF
jgi:hypothetical protein